MRLFSTEQISKYHPDKYADQISDAILTECLSQDRNSHCGIETMVRMASEIWSAYLSGWYLLICSVEKSLIDYSLFAP